MSNRSDDNGRDRPTNPQVSSDPTDGASGGSGRTYRPSAPLSHISQIARLLRAGGAVGPWLSDAGIRAGEITGYRIWNVVRAPYDRKVYLCSLMTNTLWEPGKPMTGNTREIVDHHWLIYGGVYAFKEEKPLRAAICERMKLVGGFDPGYRFVTGTVKMWGEVIEHQTGYRAEFAKPTSIDWGYNMSGTLRHLRERYGV